MDIDEYIRLNNEQSSHPELASFVKVWVESRMPASSSKLNEQFKAI